MRVTLFEYMVVISVSLNFPYPARVTLGEAKREAPPPKAEALHSRRVRRRPDPYPEGGRSRSRRASLPQGGGLARSVTPSRGRDTRRRAPRCSEVILCASAAEARPNRSPSRSAIGSIEGRHRA